MNGGRLTPKPGCPILTGDVAGSNTLAFSPLESNALSVLQNGVITQVPFTSGPTDETGPVLTLTGLTPWTAYDVFYGSDGLVLSSGWRDLASRPALSFCAGLRLDSCQRVYLGTILTDANGLLTCHQGYELDRVWSVWNHYNRRRTVLRMGTNRFLNGQSWHYGEPSWSPIWGSPLMRCSFVIGQPETYEAQYRQQAHMHMTSGQNAEYLTGLNVNGALNGDGTPTRFGETGALDLELYGDTPVTDCGGRAVARHIDPAAEGIHQITAIEMCQGTGTVNVWWGVANMCLSADFMA